MKLLQFFEAIDGRLARAKAMGFDISTPWYHGTANTDIESFGGWRGVAAHLTTDKAIANDFADARYTDAIDMGNDKEWGEGAVVYPVFIRVNNTFDIRREDHRNMVGIRGVNVFDYDTMEHHAKDIAQAGFDSYWDFEQNARKEDAVSIAVFDPANIRSVHAAFKNPTGSNIMEVRGPHEGKELELMMAGKKPLAMIELHRESPEKQEIWDKLIRSERVVHRSGVTIETPQGEGRHETDFIALPDEAWRINSIQNIYHEINRTDNMTDNNHIDIGNLLGYSEADIRHFVTGFDADGHDGYRDEDRAMMKRLGYKVSESTMTLYHGSQNEFDEFDPNMIGSSSGNRGFVGRGFYFTPIKRNAEAYGNVKAYNVTMNNPFMITGPLSAEQAEILGNVSDTYAFDEGMTPDDVWGGLSYSVPEYPEIADNITDGLSGLGYDGVVIKTRDHHEFVAFSPRQIAPAQMNEAPVRDFDVQPSATTPDLSTWGDRDKKRIANPSFETLARKKIKTGVPIDMVLMGLEQYEDDMMGSTLDNWITDGGRFGPKFIEMLEGYSGVVPPEELAREFGIKVVPATDAITAVFMSNANEKDGAMPISPWMLCHRLSHSLLDAASNNQLGAKAHANAYPFMSVPIEYLTMRSAQPGKSYPNTGEKGVEALAQFLHDGKVTLARVDEAKTLALGMQEMAVLTNGHEVYGDTGGDEDIAIAIQDLDEQLEDIEESMNIAGKHIVDGAIGKLVVAP